MFSEEMQMPRKNVEILFPFRFAVCGPMNSGKSYFTYLFLKNLKILTNIQDLKSKLHVTFCFNIENSVQSMRQAAAASGCVTSFYSQYKLPSLNGNKHKPC